MSNVNATAIHDFPFIGETVAAPPASFGGLSLTLETRLLIPHTRRNKMRAILVVFLFAVLFGCRTNESPEGQVDDLKITAQVKSKLASDIGVSSVTNISVNSTNGVVTLSGQVNSPDVKTKAEAVAKSVAKVVRVVDTLQVSPKAAPSESSL